MKNIRMCYLICSYTSVGEAHRRISCGSLPTCNAGNKWADIEANLGTQSDELFWDLDTFPIALHSTATSLFPILHAATWTPTVDKHANQFIGQRQAKWLHNFSNTGREILGLVLSNCTIPELVVLDSFQARSFCFPPATVVSSNHGGTWSTKCKLCHSAVDTFAHHDCFMLCFELHGAQQKMHDEIASALVLGTADVLSRQGQVQPRVEKHLAPRVDSLWPDCPPALRDFVPDCIILTSSYAYPCYLTGAVPGPHHRVRTELHHRT
eukprot:3437741-Rhodomonas_salina.2